MKLIYVGQGPWRLSETALWRSFCGLPQIGERDARNLQALSRILTIDLFRSYIIIYSVDADLFEWQDHWAQFLHFKICVLGPCEIRELPAGNRDHIKIPARCG